MFDLVTVGHFSIDFIVLPGETRPKKMLGGPPTYTSISARAIGSSVSVVSKVGGDFPERYLRWLRMRGVDLTGLRIDEPSKTTSFLIKYRVDWEREMVLRNRAPPIFIEDARDLETRALHISPIANEISTELIRDLSRTAPLISLDPQGLLRYFNSSGRVSLRKIDISDFLKYVEVLKASEGELKTLAGTDDVIRALRKVGELGVKVAIATIDERGVLLSFNNRVFSVPAAKPRRLVDPTGAGDTFMGGFLAEYLRGEDLLWCASVGSSAASYIIEDVGPRGFKSSRKVYERAEQIYERAAQVA